MKLEINNTNQEVAAISLFEKLRLSEFGYNSLRSLCTYPPIREALDLTIDQRQLLAYQLRHSTPQLLTATEVNSMPLGAQAFAWEGSGIREVSLRAEDLAMIGAVDDLLTDRSLRPDVQGQLHQFRTHLIDHLRTIEDLLA